MPRSKNSSSTENNQEPAFFRSKVGLDSILYNIAAGVSVQDINGRLIYANEQLAKMCGFRSAEELLANPSLIVDNFEIFDEHRRRLEPTRLPGRLALKNGKNTEAIVLYKNKQSEEELWSLVKARPVRDENGKVAYVTNIVQNITQLKIIQEKLKKSEEGYRLLVDLAPDVIYSIDTNGYFRAFNPAFETVTGFKRGDWIGKHYLEIVYVKDHHLAVEHFKRGFNEKQSGPYELRLQKATGGYFLAEFRNKPKFIDGKIEGKIGIFRDVTERSHEKRQQDFMLGIASHELKTPLASMKAFTQILQKQMRKTQGDGSDKQRIYLTRIDQQINRLTKLIGNLLDVTRIRAGMLVLNTEVFVFEELVDEVIADIKSAFASHKLIKKGSAKKYIVADRERVGRILTNLVSNAVKYSPDRDKVVIKLSTTKNEVTVSIQDFGIGISTEDQERIFEPFSDVSRKTRDKFSSVGLGLFISTELVRVHGGKIWVKSNPGSGSIFYFTLPLRQVKKSKQTR